MEDLSVAVLIPCAGSSSRLGLGVKKEYINITPEQGDTVLYRTLVPFFLASGCPVPGKNPDEGYLFRLVSVVVVVPREDSGNPFDSISKFTKEEQKKISFCPGGQTRQESVFKGLEFLEKTGPDIVLIHDGARPYVTKELILRVAGGVVLFGACAPGIQVVDTIKEVDCRGMVSRHLKRDGLRAVQTPQGFIYKDILKAHRIGVSGGFFSTDDTEVYGLLGKSTFLCEGDINNTKITYSGDLENLRKRF